MKKDKRELTTRSYNFHVRAEQDEEKRYVIEGRPIIYDSKTDLGYCDEIIERGALEFTDLTDVRFLVNHDINKIPLARSRKNNENSTMQLFVDEKGMRIRCYLDVENNTEARNLYSAIQRGDITGMSFMFSISDHEWRDIDSNKPTHVIKGISSVVEVSAVTFPAYEDTEINARDKNNLERLRGELENLKHQKSDLERSKEVNYKARTLLKIYGGN
jgi:phage prohead protease, HK97 family